MLEVAHIELLKLADDHGPLLQPPSTRIGRDFKQPWRAAQLGRPVTPRDVAVSAKPPTPLHLSRIMLLLVLLAAKRGGSRQVLLATGCT